MNEAQPALARAASWALSATLAFSAATGIARSSPSAASSASPAITNAANTARADAAHAALREIGHVRATTDFCRTTLEASDAVIDDLLGNDARVAITKTILSGADFDASPLSRANAESALQAQYSGLQRTSKDGMEVLRRLQAAADSAPTKSQRAAIDAFAAPLRDGLTHQSALAHEIAGMAVVLANRPRVDAQTHDALLRDQFEAEHGTGSGVQTNSDYEQTHGDDDADRMVTNAQQRDERGALGYRDPQGAEHNVMASASEIAQSDATIVDTLERAVLASEQSAADRMDQAFSGC